MSRGERFSRFNAAAQSFLEADVGAVDDEDCGVGPCEGTAVYRVPWPEMGGDIAYCDYHLARYRELHPNLFERVQAAVDEDLTALATRGDRFLTFEGIPDRIDVDDVDFVAVALLATGEALFEEADPDEGVTYIAVDRSLETQSSVTIPRKHAGEYLEEVQRRLGVHAWADDVEAALYGGDSA